MGARAIASEPAADVSLLKLDTMPKRALVATLGDSDKAQIGEQIFIIGAAYGIGHTLSADHTSGRHKPDTVGFLPSANSRSWGSAGACRILRKCSQAPVVAVRASLLIAQRLPEGTLRRGHPKRLDAERIDGKEEDQSCHDA